MLGTITAVKPHYLPREAAAAYCSLSVSTMEEEIRTDRFPKPRQLTKRRVGWLLAELETWCADRPVSDLLPPKNTAAKKPRATPSTTPQDAWTVS